MKIEPNTTIVDVSLNLSGSITGIPAALDQLPVGDRIGFDDLPDIGEDVEDIGQTWTPDLVGRQLDIELPLYDTLGQEKQPYSTDLAKMASVVTNGESWVSPIIEGRPVSSLKAGEKLDLPHLSLLGRGDNMRFAGEIGKVYGIGFSQTENDTFINALLSFVYVVSSEDGDGTLLMNLVGNVVPVFSHVTENGVTRLVKWFEAAHLMLQDMYVVFDTTGAVEPPAPAEAGKWSFDNLLIDNLETDVLSSEWESAPVDFGAPTYTSLAQFLLASRLLSVDRVAGSPMQQTTIDQVLNKLGSVKLQSLVVAREGVDFLAQNSSWVFCQNTASGQQLMVDLSTAEASKIGEYQESAEATTVDGYIPNSVYMYNPSKTPTPAEATVKIRMRFRPVYDETK